MHDGFVPMSTLATSSFAAIEQAHARKQLITGVPTGFKELDEMMAGLQPSDLIIVAARPAISTSGSCGKIPKGFIRESKK